MTWLAERCLDDAVSREGEHFSSTHPNERSTTSMSKATATIEERRAALAQFELDTKRVEEIEGQIGDHRRDIARQETKAEAFRAFGSKPVPVPIPEVEVPGLGMLELAPWRSARTGAELAADVESQIAHLRDTIELLELEAASLQGES
jgi:hypothetical protein